MFKTDQKKAQNKKKAQKKLRINHDWNYKLNEN